MFFSLAYAGALDFLTPTRAKDAYEKGEFDKAAKLYKELAKKGSDEATFNAADALYKAGKYEEALSFFKKVNKESLQFEKLHNMGNCYAHLGKIDEGIRAYEEALKIKEDKETRFNLELLKKIKEKKKRQKKRERNENQETDGKNSRKQNQSAGNQKKSEKSKQNDQKSQSGKREQMKQKSETAETKRDENEKLNAGEDKKREPEAQKGGKIQKPEAKREEPISEMELRKWNKVLNQRGIHTLMLPMPTKKSERSEDETTPW
ncbi:tetratricopeptide repeat protein [Hydrogenimonas urashimensis]|uniref:tetratricopeptide repeat protein n=1 Tax=Hydrogenimonas urashimensis TaxID=2740515 RepID=UPI001915688A|nr:tetratricopeptide repeat protein [Hydrogenimonas urashimensis]